MSQVTLNSHKSGRSRASHLLPMPLGKKIRLKRPEPPPPNIPIEVLHVPAAKEVGCDRCGLLLPVLVWVVLLLLLPCLSCVDSWGLWTLFCRRQHPGIRAHHHSGQRRTRPKAARSAPQPA